MLPFHLTTYFVVIQLPHWRNAYSCLALLFGDPHRFYFLHCIRTAHIRTMP